MKKAAFVFLLTISLLLIRQPVSAADPGTLVLTAQTAYVPANGEFTAVFTWTGEVRPETTLVARIHQPLTSLGGIGETSSAVLNQTAATSLQDLQRTESGEYELKIPVRSFQSNSSSDAFYLPDPGVHPVSIELFDDGKPLDSLELFLIHLPDEATLIEPVPISIIVPVSQAEGLTVRDVADVLDSHPNLPIDIRIGPGVLSQLNNDPELTSVLRDALGDREVIISPSLDLDPSALAEIDQGALFVRSVQEARALVTDLGLKPNLSVLPWDGGLTTEGVSLINQLDIDTLLVPSDSPIRPGRLTVGSGVLTVIEPDDALSSRLSSTSNGAQDANFLLAEIALQTTEDPSPVVLGGSELKDLDTEGLGIVLNSLEELGPLQPLAIVDSVDAAPTISSRTSEQPQQDLLPLADSINRIESMIETYESFYVDGGDSPSRFQTDLLSALSRERNPQDRVVRIDQIAADLDRSFESIEIGEQQAFTLTSDRFAIPLTISSGQPGPRMVRVRFQSDKIRVYSDETYTTVEDMLIELPPGDTTLTINVETRALGLSPVDVIVLTPDGSRQLAVGQFSVRSTAIPGLGLLMTGAAFVFLLVWWIRHHRKENSLAGQNSSTSGTVST